MSTQGGGRRVSGVVVTAILGGLLWGLSAQPALAALGDPLRTVNLAGTAADCGTEDGNSVALVQGSKVGFDQYPVLLMISCFASGNGGQAKAKRSTLYFVDPSGGTVVKSFQTNPQAASPGYAAAIYRAELVDVLVCESATGSLYSVDISVFNATTDGTRSAALPKPGGITSCTALAWDPSNKTTYMSNGSTIFHFNGATSIPFTPPGPVPTGCTVRGLTVVGGVLLVACDGSPTVYRRDKTTGAALGADPTVTFDLAVDNGKDMECDPLTFASPPFTDPIAGKGPRDAVWSKRSSSETVVAFEVPLGMCTQPTTLLAPAACPVGYPTNADGSPLDTDGDNLLDCWEDGGVWADGKPGIVFDRSVLVGSSPFATTSRDLKLCVDESRRANGIVTSTSISGVRVLDGHDQDPANGDTTDDVLSINLDPTEVTSPSLFSFEECADPFVKDIFVHADYMSDASGSSSHRPSTIAITEVRDAFARAPVANPSLDSPTGIRLHFEVDDIPIGPNTVRGEVPHADLIAMAGCTGPATPGAVDFDAIKAQFFGTAAEHASANTIAAKRMAYHFMLFAHNEVPGGGDSPSGCAEIGGQDAVISLGTFAVVDGHGIGDDDEQAGTVMHELGHNLRLRHGGGDNVNCKLNLLTVMNYTHQFEGKPITHRRLDYSRCDLDTINETAISEAAGVGFFTPGIGSCPSLGPIIPFFPTAAIQNSNGTKSCDDLVQTPTAAGWCFNRDQTAFGPSTALTAFVGGPNINYDFDGSDTETLNLNINFMFVPGLSSSSCDGGGSVLDGYNEWANLSFGVTAALDSADGARSNPGFDEAQEQTSNEARFAFLARDNEGDGADGICVPSNNPNTPPTPCACKITPNDSANTVNTGKKGDVKVTIFGLDGFHPELDVLRETSRLAQAAVSLSGNGTPKCNVVDIDGDGRFDLNCFYPVEALGVPGGARTLVLEFQRSVPGGTGHTTGICADTVRVVPH